MRKLLILLLAVALLAGCTGTPAGTAAPVTDPVETTLPAAAEPTEDPGDSIRTGYYLLTGIDTEDVTINGIAMVSFRGYLQILPDRTGLLSMDGIIEHVDWTERYLTIDGSTCKFTIEDNVMTLNYKYQFEATFTYQGEELMEFYRNPAPEAGVYLLTHLMDGDDVYSVREPNMTEGYFHLKGDGTGVFFSGAEETIVYWKNDTLLISSSPMTYKYFPADQTPNGRDTLVLFNFGWDMVVYQKLEGGGAIDL